MYDGCPKATFCNEQGVRCPSTQRSLHEYARKTPLAPAELLCIQGLEVNTRGRNKDSFKQTCSEIDWLLDYGQALPPEMLKEKESTFMQVNELIQTILDETDIYSKGRLPYHAIISRLAIFIPLFRQRIFGEPTSHEDIAATHAGLVAWLTNFDALYTRHIPLGNHQARKHVSYLKAEGEIQGLLTRLGTASRIPYPATIREEASEARSEHNHDFYTLDDRLRKTPLQIKTSKKGGGYTGVVTIVHRDILRAFREMPGATLATNGALPSITHLLAREQRAQEHDPTATNLLNLSSLYVTTRIDTFDDYRKDL